MWIQPLPPGRMCRVIAIRADSICRFVTYAGSSAWMPYSPNATLVPPLAMPLRLGWWCLRCLTLRGMSMSARRALVLDGVRGLGDGGRRLGGDIRVGLGRAGDGRLL